MISKHLVSWTLLVLAAVPLSTGIRFLEPFPNGTTEWRINKPNPVRWVGDAGPGNTYGDLSIVWLTGYEVDSLVLVTKVRIADGAVDVTITGNAHSGRYQLHFDVSPGNSDFSGAFMIV